MVAGRQRIAPEGRKGIDRRHGKHDFRQCRLPLKIWLKQSLGKLRLPADFAERLAAESFENLPLTGRRSPQISSLPWHHRDPFDRMLIAQAKVEELVMLTADEFLIAYGAAAHFAR